MGLRDVLRKKDRSDSEPPIPEFTLIRSDTYTEEVVYPPGGASHNDPFARQQQQQQQTGTKPRHSLDVFRSSRSRSASAASATSSRTGGDVTPRKEGSRLSRFHLGREQSSSNIPTDLPEIGNASGASGDPDDTEAQWEKRAMILARSRPSSPNPEQQGGGHLGNTSNNDRRSGAMVSTSQTDELIQQAIAFHEDGNLAQSTRLFGQLADPNGANNPLSQVLYGLALR